MRRLVLVCAAAGAVASPLRASTPTLRAAAHEQGQAYMFLQVYDDSLVVRLEILATDLERTLGLGWDAGTALSLDQVEASLSAIRAYAEARFELATSSGPMDPRFRDFDVMNIDLGDFVQLEYVIDGLDGIPDLVEVEYSVIFEVDSVHRNFLVVEHNWKTATFNNEAVFSLVFSPRTARQTLDLSSSSRWRGFVGLIWLGVLHIWIGIDHILFLIALVLPAVLMRREGTWQPVPGFRTALWNILMIVTFFTIAHSVTLTLAGLELVRLPSRFIESVIAASIAVAAWANLMPRLNVKEWAIAFGFGLFHGFGFATVMGDIGVGRDHLALSVFGFNLGVEIGQVVIIVLVFPALFLLRRLALYPRMMRVGSYGLIALALLWLGERAFDVDVPVLATILSVVDAVTGSG